MSKKFTDKQIHDSLAQLGKFNVHKKDLLYRTLDKLSVNEAKNIQGRFNINNLFAHTKLAGAVAVFALFVFATGFVVWPREDNTNQQNGSVNISQFSADGSVASTQRALNAELASELKDEQQFSSQQTNALNSITTAAAQVEMVGEDAKF